MQRNTESTVTFSQENTRLVADLGQFTTHDILQTPDLAGSGPDPCNCRTKPKECDHIFTNGDPVIVFRCFFIVKSVGRLGASGPANVATKEQVNQLSAYIDGTNVYGFTEDHLNVLRDDGTGQPNRKLFMPNDGSRGHRLPVATDATIKKHPSVVADFKTPPFLNEQKRPDYVAGDTRCQENIMLNSFHHVYGRLHNVLADGLAATMPTTDQNELFFEARQVNIAIMNHICKYA